MCPPSPWGSRPRNLSGRPPNWTVGLNTGPAGPHGEQDFAGQRPARIKYIIYRNILVINVKGVRWVRRLEN